MLRIIAAAGLMALGLASAAAAWENNWGHNPQSNFGVTIEGTAGFSGFGAGQFTGQSGFVKATKEGYSGVDLQMDADGNLCGVKCFDGGFKFDAYAGEHVKVMGGAMSHRSGMPASIANEGAAGAYIDFSFKKGKKD